MPTVKKTAKLEVPRFDEWCGHCHGNGKLSRIDGKQMRLIRERERPDLSGRYVARQLGISSSYLADMELGRREMSEETARRILEICQ